MRQVWDLATALTIGLGHEPIPDEVFQAVTDGERAAAILEYSTNMKREIARYGDKPNGR